MAPYMLSEYNDNHICLNLPLQSHGQLVRLKSTLNGNDRVNMSFQQVTNPINNKSVHPTLTTSLHNNTCKLWLPKRRLVDNHRYNNNNNNNRYVEARAGLALPLVSSSNHWGTWSILVSIAAFGIWSEKATNWGRRISGGVTSTVLGLVASNIGLIASEASAYTIANQYLLPLCLPLFLFSSDLRSGALASTRQLLPAFTLGSVATVIGTLVAWKIVPLHSLGNDGWKIIAALMSRHIGGGTNYVAISEALGVSSTVVSAGLAADNLICLMYFITLFGLSSKIPKDTSRPEKEDKDEGKVDVQNMMAALAVALGICSMGVGMAGAGGAEASLATACIIVTTLWVVLLATIFPSSLRPLASSGETLGIMLIQILFVVGGASSSISNLLKTAPNLVLFCFVQIFIHLMFILGFGKFLGFDTKGLLVASNANVGGMTTTAGVATFKGWKSLLGPGILLSMVGVAITTCVSIII